MLKFPLDRYKNQEMCDKVDDSLPILKFVPDWFVTNEIMKKLQNALFRDDDISCWIKILVMSHFQAIVIILTLMMLIFMKMILIINYS